MVVFAMRYPARRDIYKVYGATVYAIGGRHDVKGLRRVGLWVETLRVIWRVHRGKPFDVIHAIWADETGFVANLAGRLLNVPTVVSIAGGELVGLRDIGYGLQLSRFSRWLVRRALRGADRVVAPCEYAAQMAKQVVNREKVTVSPLGVDVEIFSPHPPTPSPGGEGESEGQVFRLLAVGSLIPVKDHAGLLRVFAMLKTPNVMLEIVGEGVLEESLREQTKLLGIGDRVLIRGSVTHDRLPEVYRSADVHVLTSRHEAFGMVVIEAAACGVPTVGYARGVLTELAAEGAGVAVTPDDESALAAAIDELLMNRDQLAKMGEMAPRVILEQFSLWRMCSGIKVTYSTSKNKS